MQERNDRIARWFSMWLAAEDQGIADLFAASCAYIESWGPRYVGVAAIAHWFAEWNARARVLRWDIQQCIHERDQTVVLWHFAYAVQGEPAASFDGVSIIHWDSDGKIAFLKEYACKLPHYDPYSA